MAGSDKQNNPGRDYRVGAYWLVQVGGMWLSVPG